MNKCDLGTGEFPHLQFPHLIAISASRFSPFMNLHNLESTTLLKCEVGATNSVGAEARTSETYEL